MAVSTTTVNGAVNGKATVDVVVDVIIGVDVCVDVVVGVCDDDVGDGFCDGGVCDDAKVVVLIPVLPLVFHKAILLVKILAAE